MANVQHYDSISVSPAALRAYDVLVGALGSENFAERAACAVKSLSHVDRFYLFDMRRNPDDVRPLVQFYESDKPRIAQRTYVRHYLPRDPIRRAIDSSCTPDMMIRVRVEPRDIVAHGYRRMLEHAGILERVSYLRRSGSGWQCLTVARKLCSGAFQEQDLFLLGGFARLVMPLIARNEALMANVPQSTRATIDEMERRFRRQFPALTLREGQACARAVVGMTAAGAALDLGVGVSSILTYRRRAYERLGVASACELARLVMR